MNFNVEKETKGAVKFIKDYFSSSPCRAAVIGISGGKDSSVAAALCARALGKDNVIGVLMPNNEQSDISFSHDLTAFLNIKNFTININDAYKGIAERVKEAAGDISEAALINIPPRIRMTVLYSIAQTNNGLVVGTSNASETYVGYGTKWGDLACDLNPIKQFLADEVIAIGRYLELPEHLLIKPPADGLTGKTDEEVMGFSYNELNEYIRTGKIDNIAAMDKIQRMHKASAHKRTPVSVYERKDR